MKREKRHFSYKIMYKLDEKYYDEILDMLTECDHEFIPPLSLRSTTTDSNLNLATPDKLAAPTQYFEVLKSQCFILVFAKSPSNGTNLAGFLSYIPNYSYTNSDKTKTISAQYISTIVVAPAYRNQGIARQLYEELIKRSPGKDLLTRTWSSISKPHSNESHITVLTQLGFQLFDRIKNGRGQDIDTVYYHLYIKSNDKETLSDKLKKYRMHGSIFLLVSVIIISAVSILGYIFAESYSLNTILIEILLALFTSLLVTVLTCIIDIYREYNDKKNDELLSDLYEFGITNLSRNKHALLTNRLRGCKHDVWISGYRLILTNDLRDEFSKAAANGAQVDMLLCPPWSDAYKIVYGDAPAIENYFDVFTALGKATNYKCRVHFTDKPLFSDTYKMDKHLVTGPYMHNRVANNQPITAKDFFCYDLVNDSELYQLIEQEYLSLFNSCTQVLLWDEYQKVSKEYYTNLDTLSDTQKCDILRKAIITVNN